MLQVHLGSDSEAFRMPLRLFSLHLIFPFPFSLYVIGYFVNEDM